MITSIIAWGDSILKGVVSGGDSKRFDITEKDSLSQACAALGIELANKSVFGSWMTKTRRAQDRSLRNGAAAQVGIIESGTNDSDYDWTAVNQNPDTDHLQRCPIDEFKALMKEAVEVSRQNKITPVIMIPNPLVSEWWFKNICIGNDENAIRKFVERKYGLQEQNASQDPNWATALRLYQNQELYSITAANLARSLNVQTVDMRSEFLAHPNYRELMCLDGVHPNQAGYDFMAEIWKREMPGLRVEF
ncbi:MAG: SGNH/GDSL hydrolase family protein [Treponema sp.]|nr:SGNH/GDSL hydrolase family protein [Treponema sp.]